MYTQIQQTTNSTFDHISVVIDVMLLEFQLRVLAMSAGISDKTDVAPLRVCASRCRVMQTYRDSFAERETAQMSSLSMERNSC